jgi:hypothetical protein
MKPLVDVAPGTEKIFKSELRVITGENGKSRQNYLVMFVSWARRKNKTGVEFESALVAV